MPLPSLQIVFHQLTPWPGAEALLREKAAHLGRLCPDIQSMRLVVEETQKHHRLGRPVTVRVEVHLPGHELTVSRRHDTDFHVATRTAFEAMGRRLEDLMRRRRGDVKTHAGSIHGGPVLRADDLSTPPPERLAQIDARLDDEATQDAMVALAGSSPPAPQPGPARP
jgi:hypothetical protein